MKKTLLILAFLFTTAASSFAYSSMSVHGFGETGNCEEHINDMYVNVNSYLSSVSVSGFMYNVGDCEAFYYASGSLGNSLGSYFNYYYPYFDSSPSFTNYYPSDYYSTFSLGMGAYGCDAQVTVYW